MVKATLIIDRTKILLGPPDAAAQLGITQRCLQGWIALRKIDIHHVGRMVRIRQSTVDEILEQGFVPALNRKPSVGVPRETAVKKRA